MNILFVCSANKDRSKTAEDLFSAKYPNHEFESAGTNFKLCQQYGTNELSHQLIEWADLIYAMESKHHKFIRSYSNKKLKVEVLNVRDIYKYDAKELKDILLEKINI